MKEIETTSTFIEQTKETIVIIDDKLKAETLQNNQPGQAPQAIQDSTRYKSKGVTHAQLPKLLDANLGNG